MTIDGEDAVVRDAPDQAKRTRRRQRHWPSRPAGEPLCRHESHAAIYETPGGTILLMAHRGIEQITLDKGAAHLKDELMPRYAELVYNGFWFSPEREMLQAASTSQELVTGTVRLKALQRQRRSSWAAQSPYSLYISGTCHVRRR